jgi:acyl carrier protein
VLDSTGFLELIAHLEETYQIKVTDDEMVPENLDSMASIDAYLARKRSHVRLAQPSAESERV